LSCHSRPPATAFRSGQGQVAHPEYSGAQPWSDLKPSAVVPTCGYMTAGGNDPGLEPANLCRTPLSGAGSRSGLRCFHAIVDRALPPGFDLHRQDGFRRCAALRPVPEAAAAFPSAGFQLALKPSTSPIRRPAARITTFPAFVPASATVSASVFLSAL
jgi:hypothetical protein